MKIKITKTVENVARNIGAFALLSVMLLVSISVAGRHLNIPVPGSIEIAEMLIVLIASASFIFATFQKTHATARLLIDHVSERFKDYLEKAALVFSFILCVTLAVGNIWLVMDVWTLNEESFLLSIPIVPFRIIWSGAILIASVYLLIILVKSFSHNSDSSEQSNEVSES